MDSAFNDIENDIIDLSGGTYGDGNLVEYEVDTSVFENEWDINDEIKLCVVTEILIDKEAFTRFYKNDIVKVAQKLRDYNGNVWSKEAAIKAVEDGMAWDFVDDTLADEMEQIFKLGLAKSYSTTNAIDISHDGRDALILVNENANLGFNDGYLDETYEDELDAIVKDVEQLFESTADIIINKVKNIWHSYFQTFSQN